MKRILIICICLVTLFVKDMSLEAKIVTEQEASMVAAYFFKQQKVTRATARPALLWNSNALCESSRSHNAVPAFYVFRNYPKGFVIVSGEDTSEPILGYSFKYDMPNLSNFSPVVRQWLSEYVNQIEYLRSKSHVSSPHSRQAWNTPQNGTVVKLYTTANWGQDKPFNDQCPEFKEKKKAPSGCTITAFAIIMKYYQWPEAGFGKTSPYYNHYQNFVIPSRDLTHSYNWDKMPMDYFGNYTDEQANEVATLMADVGCALQADYRPYETLAAALSEVFFDHFYYSPMMKYMRRTEVDSDRSWEKIIKNQLNECGPVLFGGDSGHTLGHMMVIDGYTDNDYFHINFGWDGLSNGFYKLSALKPNNSHQDFSKNQACILNFVPDRNIEMTDVIKMYGEGIALEDSIIKNNQSFKILGPNVENVTQVDFAGTFIGAHTDKDGNIKEFITSELNRERNDVPQQVLYANSIPKMGWKYVYVTLNKDICIGDRIRFFYKENSSKEWKLIKPLCDDIPWEIPLTDENYIKDCTSFEFDKKNEIILITTKKGVRADLFDEKRHTITDGVQVEDGLIRLNLKKLKDNSYSLLLQKSGEVKELQINLRSL